jgi:hypothetical protein
VGRFEEAIQCPAGAADQLRPRRSKATRRLSASPKEELLMKKTAIGLFHTLPAESEAPGTKINSLVKQSQFLKKSLYKNKCKS